MAEVPTVLFRMAFRVLQSTSFCKPTRYYVVKEIGFYFIFDIACLTLNQERDKGLRFTQHTEYKTLQRNRILRFTGHTLPKAPLLVFVTILHSLAIFHAHF